MQEGKRWRLAAWGLGLIWYNSYWRLLCVVEHGGIPCVQILITGKTRASGGSDGRGVCSGAGGEVSMDGRTEPRCTELRHG